MTLAHTEPQQNRQAVATVPDAAPVRHATQVTDLKAWAEQASGAYRVAEMIANTDFCPKAYRGKPEQIAASMLAGAELGFSPMTSLKAFDPIQGVAAINARAMRAIVQSHGHYIHRSEASPTRVVMEGHRKGQPDKLESVEWTIERAKTAGYVDKNPNYKSNPIDMLTARATGELCRLIASDAILGVAYTAEEIRDDPSLREPHPDERQGAAQLPRAAARGGTSMSAADLTGDAPVEAPAQAPDVSDSVEMSTQGQRKRITEAFTAAGVAAEDRGRIVGQLARPVQHTKELSRAEADDLLASLADLGNDGLAALAGGEAEDEAEDRGDEHEALFDGEES